MNRTKLYRVMKQKHFGMNGLRLGRLEVLAHLFVGRIEVYGSGFRVVAIKIVWKGMTGHSFSPPSKGVGALASMLMFGDGISALGSAVWFTTNEYDALK